MDSPDTITVVSVIKAAIGPFLGASLAFASNIYIQRRTKRQENIRAGNLALLTIASQYNDLLVFRNGLRRELARRAAAVPHAPIWLLAPAIGDNVTAGAIDFKSLVFLFDRIDGIDVHGALVLAEQHHQALHSHNKKLQTNVESLQATMAELHRGNREPSNAEMAAHVPIDVSVRVADLLKAVVAETQSEQFYLEAFALLRAAMARRFGRKACPRAIAPIEGQRDADLPPLPPQLN